MSYKRILTIQDISCVGQCSMTVALPILSVCGHETCILPTAVLSTHTGGFGKPAIRHVGGLEAFLSHWMENNILFDAILVGYLGSTSAIHVTMDILDALLVPGGIAVIDPAMADDGKLYSGFDMEYVKQMKQLCKKANVLIPNITEAALLTDSLYSEVMSEDYVKSILSSFFNQSVILTGLTNENGEIGAALYEDGVLSYHFAPYVEGRFHGTGDIFASCLVGSLMCGKNIKESIEIGINFTSDVLKLTYHNPAHSYGVKFEPLLPSLAEKLK